VYSGIYLRTSFNYLLLALASFYFWNFAALLEEVNLYKSFVISEIAYEMCLFL